MADITSVDLARRVSGHAPRPRGPGWVHARCDGPPWDYPATQTPANDQRTGGQPTRPRPTTSTSSGYASCEPPWISHIRPRVGRMSRSCQSSTTRTLRPGAVRLVGEHAGDYQSEYAAISAVARRLGMSPETLRKWLRPAAADEGQAPGMTTAASKEVRELRRKLGEPERTIDILTAAASFSRGSTTRCAADLRVHR